MEPMLYRQEPVFRSRLSFLPLVQTWQHLIHSGHAEAARVYGSLAKRFSAIPALLHPIDHYDLLKKNRELISEALSTIFAHTLLEEKQFHAIAMPFSNQVIYSSAAFREAFMEQETDALLPWDQQVAANIRKARIDLAYKLILKKLYGIELAGGLSFICAYPDPQEGIHNYFELAWDPRFIEVHAAGQLPSIDKELFLHCHHVNDLQQLDTLREEIPLEDFIFDGIMLIRVREVTDREAGRRIEELLQEDPALKDPGVQKNFRQELGYLLKEEKLDAGITSFVGNGKGWHLAQPFSLLHRCTADQPANVISWVRQELESKAYHFLTFENVDGDHPVQPLLKHTGSSALLFMGLYSNGVLNGCFEVCFLHPVRDLHTTIVKLRTILPLLEVAIQQNRTRMQEEVGQLIRDHFTAVHPAVEWKFNEAAIHYLLQSRQTASPKMERIVFDEVFPLYAAIDIRNSSNERNLALQQDLLQQLQAVKQLLVKARQKNSFPVLDELASEVEETIESVSHLFLSSGEQNIYQWLQSDVADVLHHLAGDPEWKEDVEAYFRMLEGSGRFCRHQQNFEDSITTINDHLCHFFDREQPDAQAIYPHYFERFASDGIEFNLYIGQSIVPLQPFRVLYLRNLRLWQLKALALAARHLHRLQPELALPLDTTQLVLAYNKPISISFRAAERKFDVDGIYHAQYEVVKKRIDKAYIRNTNERLTRPGSICIVYFNERDAEEYIRHINFLKKEQLLEGRIERLELEDLQGVNGLKALRVSIRLQDRATEGKKKTVTRLRSDEKNDKN